ncbi:pre-16S rRNA-processing nuclease YqgF [Synechococcus elongatus]|uniref:Pre-16S rRNA-processing nuclease YqgF n=1 Tax=Synechococcus elongatus PCC 11801 TaxID=2219813 RepID=A0AAN1UTN5_SYNEL|nr:pre-16S rRNA-processing nuclease YqgF [Synechococcus elongatus]AZB71720.1 resolvase [Synechococcus elongatus PCC 11801]
MTIAAGLWIGFDPGRDKCGLALMDAQTGQILEHRILASTEAIAELETLFQTRSPQLLVLGNQTTSRQWQAQLSALPSAPPIALVDERNSTLQARDRYWQMYPARGWRRLLPKGLRQPPRPVDDLVAILLLERYRAQL